MTQTADFSITRAGIPTVGVDGEIDLSNIAELKRAIEAAALDEAHGLVADLGRVTYLDTTALTLLDEVCRRLARRNIELHVVLPEDQHVRRSLRLVELPERLPVHDSREDARQAAMAHTVEATAVVVDHLRAALATRDTIGMAKGMLMVTREQCTPEEAFAILTRESQNRNIKLRELAQELVDLAAARANGASGAGDASDQSRAHP